MRCTVSFFLLILIVTCAPSARAAYYEWVDAQGVTHFTDDPDKVPARYQKKMRRLDLGPEGAPAPRPAEPVPAAPPPAAAEARDSFGGHPGTWWRARFNELKAEQKRLLEGLPAKETKLSELRRKRTLYMRARDRVALNQMRDEIAQDQGRLQELGRRLEALDQEANRAGVPAEWRQ